MPERDKTRPPAPSADQARQTSAQEPVREPMPRNLYISMRLPEIAAEIAQKAQERERLTSILQDPSRKEEPGQRQLRRRRAYLAERLAILRKEQADLQGERKIIAAAGGFQIGSGNRDDGRDRAKNPLIN